VRGLNSPSDNPYVLTQLNLRTSARRGAGNVPVSRPLRFAPRLALAIPVVLALGACVHAPQPNIGGQPAAPPSRSEPWRAPRGVVAPEPRPEQTGARATFPPDVALRADALTLSDVVDVALRNNPQTQLSWAQARTGAAFYGAASSAYLPTVDGSANLTYSKTTVGQTLGGTGERRSVVPALSLSYLLFDFGGRSGSVAAARASAVALDLIHNATLQNVALAVEAAYFTLQAQRGLVTAARLSLAEADTTLNSARQRNRAGVATIADVLQAQVLQAQATLNLETFEGALQTARGALAMYMGLSANARYDLAPTNDTIPVSLVAADVDTLINRALENRPDLAAARMQILQSQAEVRVARATELPSFLLGSSLTHPYSSSPNASGTTFNVNVGISIPIFNLARPYNVMAAQAQVDAFTAQANLLRGQVTQQVFTSYYALQTATQQARTTDVLIAAATQNETAARARYRAGVGTILDLVTATTALGSARAQQAQARWVWATALAQLSHDVGLIGPRGESLIPLATDSTRIRR
jgi:outer membrane protein TolC